MATKMSVTRKVDIIVHYLHNDTGAPAVMENVDPDQFCYFDLVSCVMNMAPKQGDLGHRKLVKLEYMVNLTGEKKAIIDDKEILAMFEVNKNFKFVHVYASLQLHEILNTQMHENSASCNFANLKSSDKGLGKELIVAKMSISNEVSFSTSDGDYDDALGGDEEEFGSEYSGEDSEFVVDEYEMQVAYSSDELSEGEDKFDKPGDIHSDDDRHDIYIDRGMLGEQFELDSNGKVTLKKGLLFRDVYHFREVLKDFVIQEGFEIIRLKNEKSRVTAICSIEGCDWRIHASPTPDGVTYKIKTFQAIHSCIRQTTNRDANSVWIAKKLESKLREDPNMTYAGMKAELREKWGLEPNTSMQLYRARRRVKEDSKGMHAASYNKIPAWAELARKTNPGSIFKLEVQPRPNKNPDFKRFFVCFDAMKKGFVRGCRPWFGIDGCHLKGPYGGILLSAVAIDGNKGMFPIAFAIVEGECIDSWKFFFCHLKDSLESVPEWMPNAPLTIMSDMQKGLRGAVAEFFPYARHRYCCNHLLSNLKLKFKTMLLTQMFWSVAMAHNEFLFQKGFEKLKKHNSEAAEWLLSDERPPTMWARHTIEPVFKSDHITNNVSESFNSWVGDDRKKTVLSLVESLTIRLMGRFQRRYEKGCGFDNQITPRIRKIVDMTTQDGRFLKVIFAGQGEYQVIDGFSNFVVNLSVRSCNCKYWALTGLPCKHACACISYARANVELHIDAFYSNATYLKTYAEIIHPMPDIDESKTGGYNVIIDPPILKRLPGRPRRNRKRCVVEGPSGLNDARRSSTVKCGNCNEFGHNIKTCQRAPVAKRKTKNSGSGTETQVAQEGNGNQASKAVTGNHEAGNADATVGVMRKKLMVRRHGQEVITNHVVNEGNNNVAAENANAQAGQVKRKIKRKLRKVQKTQAMGGGNEGSSGGNGGISVLGGVDVMPTVLTHVIEGARNTTKPATKAA